MSCSVHLPVAEAAILYTSFHADLPALRLPVVRKRLTARSCLESYEFCLNRSDFERVAAHLPAWLGGWAGDQGCATGI